MSLIGAELVNLCICYKVCLRSPTPLYRKPPPCVHEFSKVIVYTICERMIKVKNIVHEPANNLLVIMWPN